MNVCATASSKYRSTQTMTMYIYTSVNRSNAYLSVRNNVIHIHRYIPYLCIYLSTVLWIDYPPSAFRRTRPRPSPPRLITFCIALDIIKNKRRGETTGECRGGYYSSSRRRGEYIITFASFSFCCIILSVIGHWTFLESLCWNTVEQLTRHFRSPKKFSSGSIRLFFCHPASSHPQLGPGEDGRRERRGKQTRCNSS